MAADVHLDLLSQVHIASPCTARWGDMVGNERSRRCAQCDLNVHNISTMTRDEANAFLAAKLVAGGRVCGRLYRRRDGTILTRDCPVGLALRRRSLKAVSRIAAAIGLVSIAAWTAQASEKSFANWAEWGWRVQLRSTPGVRWLQDRSIGSGRGYRMGMFVDPRSQEPPRRSADGPWGPHYLED